MKIHENALKLRGFSYLAATSSISIHQNVCIYYKTHIFAKVWLKYVIPNEIFSVLIGLLGNFNVYYVILHQTFINFVESS